MFARLNAGGGGAPGGGGGGGGIAASPHTLRHRAISEREIESMMQQINRLFVNIVLIFSARVNTTLSTWQHCFSSIKSGTCF